MTALLLLLLVGTGVFAVTAYLGQQDYKNNADEKIAIAVEEAKKVQAEQLQKKFDEDYKKPHQNYRGSVTYGGVSFDYPKTWSAYVTEGGSQPLNGYFHPGVVPGVDGNTAYALRIEIVDTPYHQALQQHESLISSGAVRARAYVPPKMTDSPNVQPGLRLDGNLGDSQTAKNGSMVIIQVRDKTMMIYTESTDFMRDFDNAVLATLTFSP